MCVSTLHFLCLFICWFINLSWSPILAVVNSAVLSRGVQGSLWYSDFISFGGILSRGYLDCMVVVCSVFEKPPYCFIMTVWFCNPANNVLEFFLCLLTSIFFFFCFFDNSHCDWGEVSHLVVIYISLMNSDFEHFFITLCPLDSCMFVANDQNYRLFVTW